jgi:hypothetical protein
LPCLSREPGAIGIDRFLLREIFNDMILKQFSTAAIAINAMQLGFAHAGDLQGARRTSKGDARGTLGDDGPDRP